MAIDLRKFRKDLELETKAAANRFAKSVTPAEKQDIGQGVIKEMLEAIKKGISPIEGFGRFPAYKWAGRANAALKRAKTKSGRRAAKDLKAGKYPYSVQGKYPDKKERPVNLFLSGDFLNALVARSRAFGVEIGFFDDLSAKKESGHRDGVNGQPRRPIIPQGQEQFTSSIYRRILKVVQEVFDRKK